MASEDLFVCSSTVSIGYMRLLAPPGTPQREQTERYSGTDGSTLIEHGRNERVIEFEGILTYSPGGYATMIAEIKAIQEYINQFGTLRHYVGDTYEDYDYCKMNDYRRTGRTGINSGQLIVPVRARFTQVYW